MTNQKYYYPGDMIFENNLTFKDTEKHDIRINGHPILILTAANFGDKFYALKISGDYKYSERENYFPLKKNASKGIYKLSYIDLRYIYELNCTNKPPYENVVTENEFKKILKELERVQSVKEDENYKYIKDYYKIKEK